jgi:hypothetical protein
MDLGERPSMPILRDIHKKSSSIHLLDLLWKNPLKFPETNGQSHDMNSISIIMMKISIKNFSTKKTKKENEWKIRK